MSPSKPTPRPPAPNLDAQQQDEVAAFRKNVVVPSMDRIVILDFYADWCGPCQALMPVLKQVAAVYAHKGAALVTMDVDTNGFIAAQFNVRSIPAVFAIYQGKPVADMTAARTAPQVSQMLDKLIAQYQVNPVAT